MADLEAAGVGDLKASESLMADLWETVVLNRGMLALQARMVATAIMIIYMGAHGSLRRPPSAAPRQPKAGKDGDGSAAAARIQKEDEAFTDGFTASDAILFPILAGSVLVGLYYLIQWLNDPELLNKFLRMYISAASLVSLGKFMGDGLHFATSFVFPNVWTDRSGQLFRVDPANRRVLRLRRQLPDGSALEEEKKKKPGAADGGRDDVDYGVWVVDESRPVPFPGRMFLWRPFTFRRKMLWDLRHLLREHWAVKLGVHGIGEEQYFITLNGLLGVVAAGAVAIAYHVTESPMLSNLMALGMSYGAFMLMSPTSFGIGTLVLAGLFVYDVVMVFFTPYMITVATKVDAPIKLVFDNQGQSSLLGLGDIIIPGIFICLSLRFDLWRFYKKQIKRVPTELLTTEVHTAKDGGSSPKAASVVVSSVETKDLEVKAEFIDPQGRWGDWLWTLSLKNRTPGVRATVFPKTYFYATLVGYAVGMALTILMLLLFHHGQPALLYLVPCVSGAAWATGLARGELSDMWEYTEDGSLDTKDMVVEVDRDGNPIDNPMDKDKSQLEPSDKSQKTTNPGSSSSGEAGQALAAVEKGENNETKKKASEEDGKSKDGRSPQRGYNVFRLVIAAPGADDMDEDEIY